MSRPSRRTLLNSGAMLLGSLAGCLGPTREYGSAETTRTTTETSTPEPTDSEPTETSTPSYEVSTNDVTVMPELVAFDTPDSTSTIGTRDEQFVVVEIGSWNQVELDFHEFTLATNDETYRLDQSGKRTNQSDSLWPLYGDLFETETAGYLVFRLPKPLATESITLEWPGGSHSLDSNSVSKITRPPTEFEVHEMSAELQYERPEDVDVTIEVENTGTVDGTFVGALNRVGPSEASVPEDTVVMEVPAGETMTWTEAFGFRLSARNGDSQVTFWLDWRDGRAKTQMTLASKS